MNACYYLAQETKTIFNTYQPVRTEVSGIKDLTIGIAGLAFSSLWRLVDSSDLVTAGTLNATQAVQVSGAIVTQGLIKLAIPIVLSTGYLLSRH